MRSIDICVTTKAAGTLEDMLSTKNYQYTTSIAACRSGVGVSLQATVLFIHR